jgi:hypothetical protein
MSRLRSMHDGAARMTMAGMTDPGSNSGAPPGMLSFGEWLAVWTLRWIVHEPSPSSPDSDGAAPGTYADLLRAEASLRSFVAAARQGSRGVREPRLARPVDPVLTRDERRLLRALAAAQAGNEALLDNFLYKIALDRPLRAVLADGVRALAAALAAQDHRLTMVGAQQRLVPAPALAVARTHGRALDEITVAWPTRPLR